MTSERLQPAISGEQAGINIEQIDGFLCPSASIVLGSLLVLDEE